VIKAEVFFPGLEPFPGYRLVRFLGRGGWGEVWEARQPDGKGVALKFLPCDSSLASAQEIRALQSIRQLRHPHLLRIERIWCYDRHVVICMELAEGSMLDLLEVCRREFNGGIAPQHLCHFLSQAADALDYLNARQHLVNEQRVAVRHCDVKPSNLLIHGGKVKVADFSLAAQTSSTMCTHRRVGTLHYAAPEIFHGWLSERTDQYALAVSYCELRGGRLPFPDTPLAFDSSYVRPIPDLSMLMPAEQQIIRRALDPVPQDRWPSCRDLMARLTRCVQEKCAAPR
jgi:serine/threonine protein kinase